MSLALHTLDPEVRDREVLNVGQCPTVWPGTHQTMPLPAPTTHFPHLGLDFVLGLCQAPSLSLSFTHTHTGVHPLIEATGPGVGGPLAGQTQAWWSGDQGSCASPPAHTLRRLRKDFSTLALRAPAS